MFHPHDGRLVEDGIDTRHTEYLGFSPRQHGAGQSGLSLGQALIALRPQVAGIFTIDELAGNADARARLSHASFENKIYVEINPEDAAELGIEPGASITVADFPRPLNAYTSLRPGSYRIASGFSPVSTF